MDSCRGRKIIFYLLQSKSYLCFIQVHMPFSIDQRPDLVSFGIKVFAANISVARFHLLLSLLLLKNCTSNPHPSRTAIRRTKQPSRDRTFVCRGSAARTITVRTTLPQLHNPRNRTAMQTAPTRQPRLPDNPCVHPRLVHIASCNLQNRPIALCSPQNSSRWSSQLAKHVYRCSLTCSQNRTPLSCHIVQLANQPN